jgi:hypothetical protein
MVRFFERRKAAYQAFVEKNRAVQPIFRGESRDSSRVSVVCSITGAERLYSYSEPCHENRNRGAFIRGDDFIGWRMSARKRRAT